MGRATRARTYAQHRRVRPRGRHRRVLVLTVGSGSSSCPRGQHKRVLALAVGINAYAPSRSVRTCARPHTQHKRVRPRGQDATRVHCPFSPPTPLPLPFPTSHTSPHSPHPLPTPSP
ncbi:uncharacterized protein SCHCODRAFT_02178888 [Schizophyllum commune H4-8]|uniref:uncharacterized protein n=1 Tax=Schizophyllum commune (strain H4-8 / FGSC 9210) TaxID=578458 RepID=UPI00216021FE|nr:uncharacterized protein SCHCODRAFT_02178888 [Schizophyllum commune H4-8]KAI5836633.1 hypothetical protein SCHCODRAFT_02178888 [Schizophyllum commune H4-8]